MAADAPEWLLRAVGESPDAAATAFGLWLLARVLDRVGVDVAAALRSVASALRERERRPRTEPGEEPAQARRSRTPRLPPADS